jgi:hypothetical protein
MDEDLNLRRCSSAEVEMQNGGLLSEEQLRRWNMEEEAENNVKEWEMVHGEIVPNKGGFLVAEGCDVEEGSATARYSTATESLEDLQKAIQQHGTALAARVLMKRRTRTYMIHEY